MQALRKAIAETKLSNPQLSLKLGHSKKYLTNLLNSGCSTALQERLIEEISQVMAGTFKTDAMVIAELSQQLAEAQDKYTELNNHAIGNMIDKNSEIEELNKKLSDALDLADERLAKINEAKKTLSKMSGIIEKIENREETIRQSAQDVQETILKLTDNQTYLLNKYERQKRFNAILWVLLFSTVISWVAVSV